MPSYVRGSDRRRLPDAEIVRLYVEGLDSDSIGARAGCSGTVVLQIVRRAGEVVRKAGKHARKKLLIDDAELVRRYRAGESGITLADAAGTSTATIYKILRDAGQPIRRPTDHNGRRKPRPPGNADG